MAQIALDSVLVQAIALCQPDKIRDAENQLGNLMNRFSLADVLCAICQWILQVTHSVARSQDIQDTVQVFDNILDENMRLVLSSAVDLSSTEKRVEALQVMAPLQDQYGPQTMYLVLWRIFYSQLKSLAGEAEKAMGKKGEA